MVHGITWGWPLKKRVEKCRCMYNWQQSCVWFKLHFLNNIVQRIGMTTVKLMSLIQSAKYGNKLLAASRFFQLLSVSICVTCNSSVAIIQLNCDVDSEILWGFPRKIVEACKNVVTLGKTRHANTRVVTSKWINGPPTCRSRETGRKTRHHILSCRHTSTMCIWETGKQRCAG